MCTAYSGLRRSQQLMGVGHQPGLCPPWRDRPEEGTAVPAARLTDGGLDHPRLGLHAREAEQERHLLTGLSWGSASDMRNALGTDLSTEQGFLAFVAIDNVFQSPQRTVIKRALLLDVLEQTRPPEPRGRLLQKQPLGRHKEREPQSDGAR